MQRIMPMAVLAAGFLLFGVSAAADVRELGSVVSIEGRALAQRPGEPDRVLGCHDVIHEGDRLLTAAGGRLVVGSRGRHVHLGPAAGATLSRNAVGNLTLDLDRGVVRVLEVHAESPGGVELGVDVPFAGRDFELRRSRAGHLWLCDWTLAAPRACRALDDPALASRQDEHRLGLGTAGGCVEWRDAGRPSDFSSPPPVASAAPAGAFELETEYPEPCAGDECNGGVPEMRDPVPPALEHELTVAPPPVAIPVFP